MHISNISFSYLFQIDFFEHLEIDTFAKLCSVCRDVYTSYENDTIWKYYAYAKFSAQFWTYAQQQPLLASWKQCMLRILTFEHVLRKHKYIIWNETNYILYWKARKML